jgi:hypothetical protein
MRHRKIISKWFLLSTKLAYQILATCAEVICRHSFGERYRLSMLMSFCGYMCYAGCLHAILPMATPLLGYFDILYSLLMAFHLISISCGGYARVHSYSTGTSWGVWRRYNFNPTAVQLFVEPCLIAMLGLGASYWDQPLALWLYGAGLCLFIKEAISAWNRRHCVLDAIDARLEGEQMNEAIRRRMTPRGRRSQSASQSVEAPPSSQSNAPQQTEMFSNLDPGLRNLFSQGESNSPVPPANPGSASNSPEQGGPLGHLARIRSSRRSSS